MRHKARLPGVDTGWLDELPEMAAGLARDWGLTLGRTFHSATEAYVCEVTVDGTRPAVLKVLVPRGTAAADEIAVLRLTDGTGCVRMLRSDVVRGALLLERLGPALADLDLPILARHEILCATARQVWRPAPDCGLPTGADKGRWLVDYITRTWADLDRPCTERAVDHALACAQRRIRAHDDERAVLVHGDVHQWNALRAEDGYRLVDPDGLLAEAEYDLGVIMREDPVELMAGDPYGRAQRLARSTGLDPVAVWEWGVVERVSTGLVCATVDLQPVGRQMLDAADRLAVAGYSPVTQ